LTQPVNQCIQVAPKNGNYFLKQPLHKPSR